MAQKEGMASFLPGATWEHIPMNNTLPTCISVSVTDVMCFPCLTNCYHFINGNAGLFNNSYPIMSKWFDLLCCSISAYLWWKPPIVQGYLLILLRPSPILDTNITVQSGEFDTEVRLVVWSLCSCKKPFISWHILSFRGYWLKQNFMSVIGAKLWARLCNR